MPHSRQFGHTTGLNALGAGTAVCGGSGVAETRRMRELVTNVEDPRLADYARLTDMELRTSLESTQGGAVHRGRDEGDQPGSGRRLPGPLGAGRRAKVRRYPGAPPSAGRDRRPSATWSRTRPLSGSPGTTPTGVCWPRCTVKPLPEISALAAAARRVIVLEDLVDHANVGAIFRCAAALGVDAVFLSPRCADPLYRRAAKVSMGAVYRHCPRPDDRVVRRPG